MNLGLSKDLKEVFTDVKPIDRPVVKLPSTIDPNWLAGFIEGEGNFSIMVSGSPTTCPSLSPSSHIFYKIIHTDSTSVNVLLINIFLPLPPSGGIPFYPPPLGVWGGRG
jgi:hypothetical protein